MNQFLATPGYPQYVAFFCIILMAPLIEEYVFRGYIYNGIRHKKPALFTIVVTSILFVLPHMAVYYMYWPAAILLFGLAVLLALFRERYKSLVPAVLLHFGYNLILVLFTLLTLGMAN